jgi:hypothetical protein
MSEPQPLDPSGALGAWFHAQMWTGPRPWPDAAGSIQSPHSGPNKMKPPRPSAEIQVSAPSEKGVPS